MGVAVINLLATLGVAALGLIGIVVQTKSKEKQSTIENKIDLLREESCREDKNIMSKLDKNHVQTLKLWLVTEMTKIRDGAYIPNEEQKHLIHEAKREYNFLGGDSYVDDMFEDLRARKLI